MNGLFYLHDGSHNHGCEAIIRTTLNIMEKNISVDKVLVGSNHPQKDEYYLGKNEKLKIFQASSKFLKNATIDRYVHLIENKILKFSPSAVFKFSPVINACEKNMIAFSIGGDNYSETAAVDFCAVDKAIRKKVNKQVLWGCSMDERYLDPLKNENKIKSLSRFDLIVARESLTYNSLKKVGLKNVVFYPDPAFTLPIDEEIISPFKIKHTVGINVSPLIKHFENKEISALDNYIELINYIIDKTDYDIALIPHVVAPLSNSDYELSKLLISKCKKSDRIKLIEDQTCINLKTHISRCKFFVCARTHASIAAYSTKVPTLVVGYSVKAKGIAKDIFGTYKDFVLPVQELQQKTQLRNAFLWLEKNEVQIKQQLENVMPGMINKAWAAGEELKKIANET